MNRERAVFDCNVYFQSLINEEGPAGLCVSAALRGEANLFVSRFVMEEIRRTGTDPALRAKFRNITDQRLNRLIANVEKIAKVVAKIPVQFVYDRDPDDAHYVNLALAANAPCVVSRDNDLLALMDQSKREGREFHQRFPSLEIIDPKTFLRKLHQSRS